MKLWDTTALMKEMLLPPLYRQGWLGRYGQCCAHRAGDAVGRANARFLLQVPILHTHPSGIIQVMGGFRGHLEARVC